MNPEKKTPDHSVFKTDPPAFLLKDLTVRALQSDEYERAGKPLDKEHYLGDLRKARMLLQAVEYEGPWVALLDWGPSALKLDERDQWIGWTSQQLAESTPFLPISKNPTPPTVDSTNAP